MSIRMKFVYGALSTALFLSCPLFCKESRLSPCSFYQSKDYRDLLKGRLPQSDKRHTTFLQAFRWMEERSVKVLVETGTARDGEANFAGDGGSTILFSDWIFYHNRGAHLYSVDMNKDNLLEASKAIKDKKTTTFVHDDSIHFLKNFSEKIDFLYLDSCDFDVKRPYVSQEHHLQEIKAAYDKLSPEALVMIDDCKLPYGGKGKLVIRFLQNQGWKIIADSYQVILTR